MLGFLGSATRGLVEPLGLLDVSIPCWVFWVLRRWSNWALMVAAFVSIPCWVFWVLRRGEEYERLWNDMFQSRAGFSGFCDGLSHRSSSTSGRFNPVLGFLGSATRGSGRDSSTRPSFNPVLGFLGSATRARTRPPRRGPRFNPVLGFLGSATAVQPEVHQSVRPSFNPVLGFLGSATFQDPQGFFPVFSVSIPCWVFWVLRQGVKIGPEAPKRFLLASSATPTSWTGAVQRV